MGAEVPSLPGCAAWGYTREEALEALGEAAQAYLELWIEKKLLMLNELESQLSLSAPEVVKVTV